MACNWASSVGIVHPGTIGSGPPAGQGTPLPGVTTVGGGGPAVALQLRMKARQRWASSGGREPVSLDLVAAVLAQELHLRVCLDAFGDHVQPERTRHRDDRGGDRGVVGSLGKVVDELLVDLQAC